VDIAPLGYARSASMGSELVVGDAIDNANAACAAAHDQQQQFARACGSSHANDAPQSLFAPFGCGRVRRRQHVMPEPQPSS
jgi:hypothetical protein